MDEEIRRALEELVRGQQEFTQANALSIDSLDKSNSSRKKLTEGQQKALAATKSFTSSVKDVFKQFDQNAGKMQGLNSVVGIAASGLTKMGFAGQMAAVALEAIAGLTFEEVDKTLKDFQKIASVGAIGVGGMSEFRDAAHQGGLIMNQFANAVTRNSQALAIATSDTLEGAKALSDMGQVAGASGLQRQLMNLGVTVEDQRDYFADHLFVQRRMGNQINRDYRGQTEAAGDYIKRLVMLSRLTGETVTSVKQQLEAQRRNLRFRAAMQDLENRFGKKYRIAKEAEILVLGKKFPHAIDGVMDAFSGFNTDAASKSLVAFGGALRTEIDAVKRGDSALGQFSQGLVEGAKANRERFGGPGMLGVLAGTGGKLDTLVGTLLDVNQAAELTPEFFKQINDQIESLANGSDDLTKRLMESAENTQKIAVQSESAKDLFLNIGSTVLPSFTSAMVIATTALNRFTKALGFGLDTENSVKIDATRAEGGPVKAGGTYLVGEQGPELMIPGASGQITNADITRKLAAIGRGSTLKGNEDGGPVYGSATLTEGLKNTFMPGIGNVTTFKSGGITKTIIETLNGAIEEYMSATFGGITQEMYSAGGQKYQRMTANYGDITAQTGFIGSGPRSYYDSVMDNVRPQDLTVEKDNIYDKETYDRAIASNRARSSSSVIAGMNNITDKVSSEILVSMFSEMKAEMQKIADYTRTGADASKKLLRASTG